MKIVLLILLAFSTSTMYGADAKGRLQVTDGDEYSTEDLAKTRYKQQTDRILTRAFRLQHHKASQPLRQYLSCTECDMVTTVNKFDFVVDETFLLSKHFYCKPIGLILIFPKHYFW